MADALVSLEASDVFGLGGSFIAQSASKSTDLAHAKMKKANGDYEKFSTTFDQIENISVVYKFNSDTGLGAALPEVGSVNNAYIVTGLDISTTFDDYPEITVTGHQHEANAHEAGNTYAISDAIQTIMTGAVGAYDFAGEAGDPVCTQSSTYSLTVNHIDDNCDAGDHWVGTNIEGMESITVNYIGNITSSPAPAGFTLTNYSYDDSNEAHDVSSMSAEALVVRTA